MKSEKSKSNWYFLLFVILLYIITYFLKSEAILTALEFLIDILIKIIPIFVLIFLLMILVNYFVTPERVKKYIGEKASIKSWSIAVITGILSTGPIYMWYPMLRELKDKGVGYGFIAAFLYNRAIKIPLLPIIILYFGVSFTIILTVVMIIFSVIQGKIIENNIQK